MSSRVVAKVECPLCHRPVDLVEIQKAIDMPSWAIDRDYLPTTQLVVVDEHGWRYPAGEFIPGTSGSRSTDPDKRWVIRCPMSGSPARKATDVE